MLATKVMSRLLLVCAISSSSYALESESLTDSVTWYLADVEKRAEKPWKLVGGLGATIKTGNTDIATVAMNIQFNKQWETFLLKMGLQSIYTYEDNAETASEHILTQRVEKFLGQSHRMFQASWLETDSDEHLSYRFWISLGYGKRFTKTKNFELWGDVGAGVEWEKYYGQAGGEAGFVQFSIDWDWQVTEALLYEQIFRWQQYFQDNGRYKIFIEARFSLPVSKHWTFMMLIRDEYNSDPNPPNFANDVTMILTLNFNFTGGLEGKPDSGA
jgi:putative salt-induced outer membrane protein YdiY